MLVLLLEKVIKIMVYYCERFAFAEEHRSSYMYICVYARVCNTILRNTCLHLLEININ